MNPDNQQNLYVETYGCQMNLSDSEVIQGLMYNSGFNLTTNINDAQIILLNTCSVREHAEERVLQRIRNLKSLKRDHKDLILGVIGCMAERLKGQLFEIDDSIDIILGPDDYRKLPEYILKLKEQSKILDTELNYSETYDDIIPFRSGSVSAWIPIMRGCDNYCSYCIVPYTRGRERSRSFNGIIDEAQKLIESGYKEIYLLGQNVNSYSDSDRDFSDLLSKISRLESKIRVRFMTSHPKDFSDKLINMIAEHSNICKSIHLPFQSGSNKILKLMNRNYTREAYLVLISKIRSGIPEIGLSTDIIVGYPTETDQDFQDTINLLEQVEFDSAFTFKYSPREGTTAFEYPDDIPEEVKSKRLNSIIKLQQALSLQSNRKAINQTFEVLVESESKKSKDDLQGRLDNNKVVVFPRRNNKTGDFVNVKVFNSTSATLIGEIA
jgi:tRNA-2-methylthio-N6-dimethylallyladenosine synthase